MVAGQVLRLAGSKPCPSHLTLPKTTILSLTIRGMLANLRRNQKKYPHGKYFAAPAVFSI